MVLGVLLLSSKIVNLFVYDNISEKFNYQKVSNTSQDETEQEPINDENKASESIIEVNEEKEQMKQEIKESYVKIDEDGWKGLKMRCPVQECIDLNDNNVYYWKHPGSNTSHAMSQLPDVYPIQINKNGQMRCGGCKGSTVKDYSEYIWEGCSTHSGAKKGKDGYLMKFIRENNYFDN